MTPASFEELARLPEEELDVALGAALVARDAYDALDVPALLADLEGLGGPTGAEARDDRSLRDRVIAVSARFTEIGFHGNTDDYYDPRNSLLPDVLARKTGIPITLSIVWCAMAKTAGLQARGIAFPGHFLVRVDDEGAPRDEAAAPVIVDPFQGGSIVDDGAAAALLRRALGDGAALHPSLFVAASARVTLVRLLTNLQATYAKRGEYARAFIAVDRIVTLVPDSARMLRERGALALRIGATEVARADFARVVELEPQAPDIPQLQARLANLATPPRTTLH
ncbi:MAG TPA: tetratricopeptide repeat protein [Labilithrix sp.]|nr:tetratricopeptide repeat protein [Labilithrix sp.]